MRANTFFEICHRPSKKHLLGDALAVYEPDPNFVDVMPAASRDRQAAKKFLLEKKLPAIAASVAKVYAETSHVFCKGFLGPLIDLGVVPHLMLLNRPHR
jgi:hypothetical protein